MALTLMSWRPSSTGRAIRRRLISAQKVWVVAGRRLRKPLAIHPCRLPVVNHKERGRRPRLRRPTLEDKKPAPQDKEDSVAESDPNDKN